MTSIDDRSNDFASLRGDTVEVGAWDFGEQSCSCSKCSLRLIFPGETARIVVQEKGGDYLFMVKGSQSGVQKNVQQLHRGLARAQISLLIRIVIQS